METSTPVRGNQEGTGRDEPEMRDLPASVSWIVSHEPHLFSLWWRWSGSDVGSPTGVPSCRPVPTLTGSASTDIYSCFPLPCGKHSASAGRRLPTGAPTPAHLSWHAHSVLAWTISVYPVPSVWATSVSPKQSPFRSCLPSWTLDSQCQRQAYSFLRSP